MAAMLHSIAVNILAHAIGTWLRHKTPDTICAEIEGNCVPVLEASGFSHEVSEGNFLNLRDNPSTQLNLKPVTATTPKPKPTTAQRAEELFQARLHGAKTQFHKQHALPYLTWGF